MNIIVRLCKIGQAIPLKTEWRNPRGFKSHTSHILIPSTPIGVEGIFFIFNKNFNKNEESSTKLQNTIKMISKQIISIFIIAAGVAMTVYGFALTMIPLLVIGIPIAAIGGVVFLL